MSHTQTSIEPILGWRVWHVDPRGEGALLHSWCHSGEWPAGRRMEASCRSLRSRLRPSRCHDAPQPGHACGIYALHERTDAEALLRQLGEVGPTFDRLAAALGRGSCGDG